MGIYERGKVEQKHPHTRKSGSVYLTSKLTTQPATESATPTCPEKGPEEGLANTSLIIIDEDELNFNNESQVIQRIIEEYERRLQEQLALARQDIATELEQQIQVS